MPFSLTCECGRRLIAKEQMIGKRAKCPACGRSVLVEAPRPAAADSPAQTEASEILGFAPEPPKPADSRYLPEDREAIVALARAAQVETGRTVDATQGIGGWEGLGRYILNVLNTSDESRKRWQEWRKRIGRKPKLFQANLSGLFLHGADLEGVDLVECNFSETQGAEINIQDSDLTRANFSNCKWARPWMNGARIIEANLTGASFEEVTLVPSNWSGSRFVGTRLHLKSLACPVQFTDAVFSQCVVSRSPYASPNIIDRFLECLTPKQRAGVTRA